MQLLHRSTFAMRIPLLLLLAVLLSSATLAHTDSAAAKPIRFLEAYDASLLGKPLIRERVKLPVFKHKKNKEGRLDTVAAGTVTRRILRFEGTNRALHNSDLYLIGAYCKNYPEAWKSYRHLRSYILTTEVACAGLVGGVVLTLTASEGSLGDQVGGITTAASLGTVVVSSVMAKTQLRRVIKVYNRSVTEPALSSNL